MCGSAGARTHTKTRPIQRELYSLQPQDLDVCLSPAGGLDEGNYEKKGSNLTAVSKEAKDQKPYRLCSHDMEPWMSLNCNAKERWIA